LSLVSDPQKRDVADGLEQATNAKRREAIQRLGIRREIDLDEAKDVLASDRIPQGAVGIVDKILEAVREWAAAPISSRNPKGEASIRLLRRRNISKTSESSCWEDRDKLFSNLRKPLGLQRTRVLCKFIEEE
jgi:hypothetical protein